MYIWCCYKANSFIRKVFVKSGNGSKIWGTDHKFEETDQQIEIFKVFVKSGNGSKIWGTGHKFEETDQ